MFEVIIIEFMKGIGMLFLHPFTYICFVTMVLLGLRRVRRERRDFHTRVYDVVDDVARPLLPGLLVGLSVSVLALGVGVIIPVAVMVLVAVVYVLLMFTGKTGWLAPIYPIGISVLLVMLLPHVMTGLTWVDQWFAALGQASLPHLMALSVVLLLAEAILIGKDGKRNTSPLLRQSKRGKYVGLHQAKRQWFVPLFVLVPGGEISFMSWWPVLPFDAAGSFGIMLLPFAVGYQQTVQATLPHKATEWMARRVFAIVTGLAVLVVLCFYVPLPVVMAIVVLAAMAMRAFISWQFYQRDHIQSNYFARPAKGIVTLGVLPKTTAAKLGLKVGETITRVNGIQVNSEYEFYQALQKNSAYCKLEVLDEAGEIRFVRGALYDGAHHQLGVLFVKEEYDLQDSIV